MAVADRHYSHKIGYVDFGVCLEGDISIYGNAGGGGIARWSKLDYGLTVNRKQDVDC